MRAYQYNNFRRQAVEISLKDTEMQRCWHGPRMFIHLVITEYAGRYTKLPTRFPHQVNSDTFAQAFQRALQIES